MIREYFDWVVEKDRRVLVIDELDAVARSRRNHGNMHTDEMADVNELLVQLDRASRLGRIVVGTTNYVASLDDAVIRSGRFGHFIPVPPPDLDAAAAIVTYYLNRILSTEGGAGPRIESARDLDVRALLDDQICECKREERFFCGADLEVAVNQTYQRCRREALKDVSWSEDQAALAVVLTPDELKRSLRKVRKSIDSSSLQPFLDDVERYCGKSAADDMKARLKPE